MTNSTINSQSITQAKVAIITVTYNASVFIGDYLRSITGFLHTPGTVAIITDNASTDNTCDIIRAFINEHQLESQMTLLCLDTNIGFGKGCNAGFSASLDYSPEYAWFLNPDTIINDNSGQALVHWLDSRPDISFAGSTLMDDTQSLRSGAFRFPSIMNVFLANMRLGILDRLFNRYTTAEPLQTEPQQSDWLTGASFMARAKDFQTLGGFDPEYFLYFEEVDLFKRATKIKLAAYNCPSSQVYHISGASTGINKKAAHVKRHPSYWYESRRHYYISNHGYLYFLLTDIIFAASHLTWLLRATLQKKPLTTPPHYIKDTFYHGHIKPLITNLTRKSNQ